MREIRSSTDRMQVIELRHARPTTGQDRSTEFIALYLPYDIAQSCQFKAQIKPANAAAEATDPHFSFYLLDG